VAVAVDPADVVPPAPPVDRVLLDGDAGDPVEPLPMPVFKRVEDTTELLAELITTEDRVLEGQ